MLFLDWRIVVVAHASIDRKARRYTPIVLKEGAPGGQVHKSLGITNEDIALVRVAGKKIFEGGTGAKCIPAVLESDSAFAAPVPDVVGAAPTVFPAEVKCMLASRVGNVVQELVGHVWRRFEGPTPISADLGKWADQDCGHAKVDRRGNTRVYPKPGHRILCMVSGQNGLPEAVPAEARLVDPSGVRNPGVVESEHLGTEIGLGFPLRSKDDDILLRLQAVAKKIAPRNAMALIEMVIRLHNKCIHSVRVRKATVDIDAIRAIVGREETRVGTVAGECSTSDEVCAQRIQGIGIHRHPRTSEGRRTPLIGHQVR